MSAIKHELVELIRGIPDEKLTAIKPLLTMLYEDTIVVEPVLFDDLDEEEKAAVLQGMGEDERGETVRLEDIEWDKEI